MKIKFIGKVKLTKQGQLTLPLEARKDLNIKLGADLFWYEFNDYLVIIKEIVNTKELVKSINKAIKSNKN